MNDDRESLARAAPPDLPDGEDGEIARRLKALVWPAAPADVKERCLREILEQTGTPHPDGKPPSEADK